MKHYNRSGIGMSINISGCVGGFFLGLLMLIIAIAKLDEIGPIPLIISGIIEASILGALIFAAYCERQAEKEASAPKRNEEDCSQCTMPECTGCPKLGRGKD